MDHDLDKALSHTIKETVKFLGAKYRLTPGGAYSLCSTAIDFGLAEAVDLNLVIQRGAQIHLRPKNALLEMRRVCPNNHHATPSDLTARLLP